MKKITFVLFFITYFLNSQTVYKTVESVPLQQTRELKIQLPPNYDENKEKSYPVIVVLDGDYLFEIVAGNVQYYSYWNEIPESIVVGVNQSGFRTADVSYNKETSFPTKESAAFYQFLKTELMPHIKANYRISDFKVILGIGSTANFINYFLFKDPYFFNAFVNISPDYTPRMENRIVEKLSHAEEEFWYYLATGTNDFKPIKNDAIYLQEELERLKNKKLHFYFDNFEGKNHYSLVGFAVPAALEKIFSPYGPILPKECEEIGIREENYCAYLLHKYKTIEDLYSLDLKIRTNDFMAIASAIEKNKKWEAYEELSKIAKENYPESMLHYYFKARFYEGTVRPKKALHSYIMASNKKKISFLTKDLIWDQIYQLKSKFGY